MDGDGVVVVGLTNVWLATQSDGLVRAAQITGIDAHQTPALNGKPAGQLHVVTGGGRAVTRAITITALDRLPQLHPDLNTAIAAPPH